MAKTIKLDDLAKLDPGGVNKVAAVLGEDAKMTMQAAKDVDKALKSLSAAESAMKKGLSEAKEIED